MSVKVISLILVAAMLVMSAASASTPIPTATYCAIVAGNAISASVMWPQINVSMVSTPTLLDPNASSCTMQGTLFQVKGTFFATFASYGNDVCPDVQSIGVTSYKASVLTIAVVSTVNGKTIKAPIALKSASCGVYKQTTYCGYNAKYGYAVLSVGKPFLGLSYDSADGVPIEMAFRPLDSPASPSFQSSPYMFSCIGTGSSTVFAGGNLFVNNLYFTCNFGGSISSATITKIATGLRINATQTSPTNSAVSSWYLIDVTEASCTAVPVGAYGGAIGTSSAMVIDVQQGGVARVVDGTPSTFESTFSPFFVIKSRFLQAPLNGYSPNNLINITSLTYAPSTGFTVTYFNKTSKTAVLNTKSVLAPINATYCTKGATLTLGKDHLIVFANESSTGITCSISVQGYVLIKGNALWTSYPQWQGPSCPESFFAIEHSATAGFSFALINLRLGKTTSVISGFKDCTATKPSNGLYCGATGNTLVTFDPAVMLSAVNVDGDPNGQKCATYGPIDVLSTGVVVNSSSDVSCPFPFGVTAYSKGVYSVVYNSSIVAVSQAACQVPTVKNGTFCGGNGDVAVVLNIDSSYDGVDYTFELTVSSPSAGLSQFNGLLDASLSVGGVVSVSNLYPIATDSPPPAQFTLTSLALNSGAWTVTGVLGATPISVSVSSSGCGSAPENGLCGVTGTTELALSDMGGIDLYWTGTNGVLSTCSATGPIMWIGGQGYYSPPTTGMCVGTAPLTVTGLTYTAGGVFTAAVKVGKSAKTVTLSSTNCKTSIIPQQGFCSTTGTASVFYGDGTSVRFAQGSCIWATSLSGVKADGTLILANPFAPAEGSTGTCASTIKSVKYTMSKLTIVVTLASGTVTLTQKGCGQIPKGNYCGTIGSNVIGLVQDASPLTSITTDRCLLFTALVLVKTTAVPMETQSYCNSGSFNLTAVTYANKAISMTIDGTKGSLTLGSCNAPTTPFCSKIGSKTYMAFVGEQYGAPTFFVYGGNTTSGVFDAMVNGYIGFATATGIAPQSPSIQGIVTISGKTMVVTVTDPQFGPNPLKLTLLSSSC